MLKNRADLMQAQKEAVKKFGESDCRILVCSGTGCVASGSEKIYKRLLEIVEGRGDVILEFSECGEHSLADASDTEEKKADHLCLLETGCQGLCEKGPLVRITKKNSVVQYIRVKEEDCQEIVEKSVLGDEVIDRLLVHDREVAFTRPDEIPFIAKQTRIVLENCGDYEACSLQEYLASGGFQGLQKAMFEMERDQVISEIEDSGLRGRGGGGFPTGRKWRQVASQEETIRYVVCNGDEGDPGAFMDGSVMEGDPFKMIEGMMLAGYAVRAQEGYIYVRAEYPLSVARLRRAIAQLEEVGLLGEHILGTDFSFRIHINRGAGAFVCGEGSALTASIEGKRGMPRVKPPRTVEKGLWAKPTVLNNVETFANVPKIVLNGSDWYRTIGSENSPGTKTFSLTGSIENTGLIEVPMGTTLREIIYDIGGGLKDGATLKAVQIGGPSGGCLTVNNLDMGLDFDSLAKCNAIIGSGGMVVMDEETCMVEVARFFMSFTQRESCGKCVPCREGTKRMLEILERIVDGTGTLSDLDEIEELADVIEHTALCGLGKSASKPVISTLHAFHDEYVEHIRDKKCRAGVCTALRTYSIASDLCKGCGRCAKNCPVEAIVGEIKSPFTIDNDKCIKCGTCIDQCAFDAIHFE